jgi:hypothetical protein
MGSDKTTVDKLIGQSDRLGGRTAHTCHSLLTLSDSLVTIPSLERFSRPEEQT